MMLLGFGPILFPLPRTNAAWFTGLFVAVVGFAVLVLLVVVGNCGAAGTGPLPDTSGSPPVTADCYPFCVVTTGAAPPG
ncbi:hypothetical protein IU501_31810 [Nocardia otitidiscaviarum]|uniref:hypothetical protein n=1 Tax=Nocardia otitidiscaviarum TaxID=1823 RepID=UPI000B1B4ADB|nr:hypothetical protein [Nocardia otitidiscaviarum]MBF6137562.1 hypothetical protein [Nocardia otitidiscaviarum]MBF6488470.1 hypothetical protein [Nocardia otitidiscaviarum]